MRVRACVLGVRKCKASCVQKGGGRVHAKPMCPVMPPHQQTHISTRMRTHAHVPTCPVMPPHQLPLLLSPSLRAADQILQKECMFGACHSILGASLVLAAATLCAHVRPHRCLPGACTHALSAWKRTRIYTFADAHTHTGLHTHTHTLSCLAGSAGAEANTAHAHTR